MVHSDFARLESDTHSEEAPVDTSMQMSAKQARGKIISGQTFFRYFRQGFPFKTRYFGTKNKKRIEADTLWQENVTYDLGQPSGFCTLLSRK